MISILRSCMLSYQIMVLHISRSLLYGKEYHISRSLLYGKEYQIMVLHISRSLLYGKETYLCAVFMLPHKSMVLQH